MESKTILCEYCHTPVPYRAKVCTGCQAKVSYGTPAFLIFLLATSPFLIMFMSAKYDIELGFYLMFPLPIFIGILCKKLFRNNVSFTRYTRSDRLY
ncbi:Uncharacterised protein [Neisseria zoodegmatis]|uniref:Uncharacterized protein n=1 Tax=Neisseria zoodegmatis TaxID=326523 RepID=A0AB38DST6_9NEIS|nr:Uncharacterised protein [Neisseria zoodegmatis]